MAKLKPIDLKEVAKKFTEKYYTQWLSRVDRIWEMFEKIDPNALFSESANSQNHPGNAFGITGDIEPKFKECISGIAILAFTYQGAKDKDSISEKEIKKRISIVPASLNMSAGLQKKLESVLSEMVEHAAAGNIKTDKKLSGYKEQSSFAETYDYRIWYNDSEPSGLPIDISLKEKIAIKEKDKYDLFIIREEALTQIFINGDSAVARPSKTGYRILAFSLKYRGNCGTAWNIAKYIYSIDETEKFRDLREMAKAIQEQSKLKSALKDFKDEAGNIENYSNRVRKFINSLNHEFLIYLDTSLKANKMGEYELNPMIKYCLIEKS